MLVYNSRCEIFKDGKSATQQFTLYKQTKTKRQSDSSIDLRTVHNTPQWLWKKKFHDFLCR